MTKIANVLKDSSKNKKLEKNIVVHSGWEEALQGLSVVNSVNIPPVDLKPSDSMVKDKKPPGEFDDSLV